MAGISRKTLHELLGISPHEHPVTAYRLLGVELYENDPAVLQNAAQQRLAKLAELKDKVPAHEAEAVLTMMRNAEAIVSDAERKSAYDEKLRNELAGPVPATNQNPTKSGILKVAVPLPTRPPGASGSGTMPDPATRTGAEPRSRAATPPLPAKTDNAQTTGRLRSLSAATWLLVAVVPIAAMFGIACAVLLFWFLRSEPISAKSTHAALTERRNPDDKQFEASRTDPDETSDSYAEPEAATAAERKVKQPPRTSAPVATDRDSVSPREYGTPTIDAPEDALAPSRAAPRVADDAIPATVESPGNITPVEIEQPAVTAVDANVAPIGDSRYANVSSPLTDSKLAPIGTLDRVANSVLRPAAQHDFRNLTPQELPSLEGFARFQLDLDNSVTVHRVNLPVEQLPADLKTLFLEIDGLDLLTDSPAVQAVVKYDSQAKLDRPIVIQMSASPYAEVQVTLTDSGNGLIVTSKPLMKLPRLNATLPLSNERITDLRARLPRLVEESENRLAEKRLALEKTSSRYQYVQSMPAGTDRLRVLKIGELSQLETSIRSYTRSIHTLSGQSIPHAHERVGALPMLAEIAAALHHAPLYYRIAAVEGDQTRILVPGQD